MHVPAPLERAPSQTQNSRRIADAGGCELEEPVLSPNCRSHVSAAPTCLNPVDPKRRRSSEVAPTRGRDREGRSAHSADTFRIVRRVLEVVIDVPARDQQRATKAAYALGAQGLEIRDEQTGAPKGRVQVVTWMPMRTRIVVPNAIVRTRPIEASWLEAPKPTPIGKRFVVIDLDAPLPRRRIPIRVDASLGFGDGLHPTTILCLEALERTRAETVLDVGTGTGILAVAAAKLGAEVVATDIDPLARDAARRAMKANDVKVRVLTKLPRGPFDLVVANLYLEPLVALAGELAPRADRLIVSGFTDGKRVRAAFGEHRVTRETTRGGWTCLELTPRR